MEMVLGVGPHGGHLQTIGRRIDVSFHKHVMWKGTVL